jgi:protoporphyrinogen oxidase
MRIAIIGGGLTGLSAAYELSRSGHSVTVFEKESVLGGLAHGFQPKNWSWPLEFAYHHFFTNDDALIKLAKEIGLEDKLIISRPITSTLLPQNSDNKYISDKFENKQQDVATKISESAFASDIENMETHNSFHERTADPSEFSLPSQLPLGIYQLDSPLSLLKFDKIPFNDRIRTGAMLAYCKINPFWKPLEKITAQNFIRKYGGEAGWKTIWEPLLYGKFNSYADKVAASWFWARIKKRTSNLGYFQGGFQELVNQLEKQIKKLGGVIYTDFEIENIVKSGKTGQFQIKSAKNIQQFDKVLLTVPTPIASKLVNIPKSYFIAPLSIPHLWAQTLILETDTPVLDKVYWLNVNDRNFPFLACVAHTNFMDKSHYGGHHITYFGNYLPEGHPYLSLDKKQLYSIYRPFIDKLVQCQKLDARSSKLETNNHPSSNFHLLASYLFTVPFAQPVHELDYSKRAPKMETPVPGLYLANLDSIYPWDRGTNYAVELGQKAARLITQKNTT